MPVVAAWCASDCHAGQLEGAEKGDRQRLEVVGGVSSLDTHLAHRALAGDRRCCVNGSRQSRRCDDSAIAAETFVCERKDEKDQIRLEGEEEESFQIRLKS